MVYGVIRIREALIRIDEVQDSPPSLREGGYPY